MKRSERGFERVGHFFLSGSCPEGAEKSTGSSTTTPHGQAETIVPLESGTNPGKNMAADVVEGQKDDTDLAGSCNADAPAMHSAAEQRINKVSQAYDCIGGTVARLEVLKRACQGATLAAESPSGRAIWFRGAAAIIQEAMATLSEIIDPVCPPKTFLDERDAAGDGT